jgi:broad specificity phosphatase PhoE
MITLIRHSERLDNTNYKKWIKSKRFKENKYDTPITINGKKLAKKAYNKLFDSGYQNVDYIYCSPLTRCIQTCLEIKKEIKKKLKKDIKIRIEYGLVENNFDNPLILKKNKFIVDKKSKKRYLDNKLNLNELVKKYGSDIDENYKSITNFIDIGFDLTEANFMNRSAKVFEDIRKQVDKNDDILIVTHGGIIFGVYSYITKKYDISKQSEVVGEYCSILVTDYKKKKLEIINKFDK